MAAVPFSWMYRDPAEITDRLRTMRAGMAEEEKRLKEIERRKKRRHIRKLTKLAMSGKLKGNTHGR